MRASIDALTTRQTGEMSAGSNNKTKCQLACQHDTCCISVRCKSGCVTTVVCLREHSTFLCVFHKFICKYSIHTWRKCSLTNRIGASSLACCCVRSVGNKLKRNKSWIQRILYLQHGLNSAIAATCTFGTPNAARKRFIKSVSQSASLFISSRAALFIIFLQVGSVVIANLLCCSYCCCG